MKNRSQHKSLRRNRQAELDSTPTSRIESSTPFDFEGRSLTPYGGLLPLASMLEKLQFRELVEELITVKRQPRSMSVFQFILAQALAIYVGFARLHHLQFVARDPMREVDHASLWADLRDHAMADADELVVVAVVRQERDHGVGHVEPY